MDVRMGCDCTLDLRTDLHAVSPASAFVSRATHLSFLIHSLAHAARAEAE